MRLVRIGLLLAVLLPIVGCVKARFSVDQPPRFSTCTGTDPATGANNDPQPRPHEDPVPFGTVITRAHQQCQAFGQALISGYDVVNRYDKIGTAGPTERVFHTRRTWTKAERMLPAGTGTCMMAPEICLSFGSSQHLIRSALFAAAKAP